MVAYSLVSGKKSNSALEQKDHSHFVWKWETRTRERGSFLRVSPRLGLGMQTGIYWSCRVYVLCGRCILGLFDDETKG